MQTTPTYRRIATRSMTPKGHSARERIRVLAEPLFAERGFHGTSMRDVAEAASVPLATVVYHFQRKEKLYAAVLAAINDQLMQQIAIVTRVDDLAGALVHWTQHHPERVRLLLREVLDNPTRVARAGKLPLGPFLEAAARIVGGAFPELAVLHAVGGLSYVVAARPTIDRIVGPSRAAQLSGAYDHEALAFARRAVDLERAQERERAHAFTYAISAKSIKPTRSRRAAGKRDAPTRSPAPRR